jgi:hypothetical protein
VLEDHRGDVVVLADGEAGGNAVLTHFLTSIDLVTGGRIAVAKTNGAIPAARRQWVERDRDCRADRALPSAAGSPY